MNWKKRYTKVIVGDKLRCTKDLSDIDGSYPSIGEIVTVIKLNKEATDGFGYEFNDDGDYLVDGEFKKVVE